MAEQFAPGIWLPAEPITEINGEPVPAIQLPLSSEKIGALVSSHVPWTTGELDFSSHEAPEVVTLRPTEIHGRSTILDLRTLEHPQQQPQFTPYCMWRDEYDNPFTSLSYKGNVGDAIAIQTGMLDPQGVRFHGLQTTYALERCLRASRIFRANDIDTELIMAALIPTEMPFREKVLSPRAVKQTLYTEQAMLNAKDALEANQDPQPTVRFIKGPSDENLKAMQTAMNESEFVVTARAMSISERLWDLFEDSETAQKMLNRALHVTHLADIPFSGPSETPGDAYESLLSEVTAYRLGVHLRRMADLGLAHRMLHAGNINLLGGIVDLDSVIGKAIGLIDRDDEVTTEHALTDVQHVFNGLDGNPITATLRHLEKEGLIGDAEATITRYYRNLYRGYFSETAENRPADSIALSEVEFLNVLFDANRQRHRQSSFRVWDVMEFAVTNLDEQHTLGTLTSPPPIDTSTTESLCNQYLAQCLEQPCNQSMIETMRDIADIDALEQAAINAFADKMLEADNLTELTKVIFEIYSECAERNAAEFAALPDSNTEFIYGRRLQIMPETSLPDALQQLQALDIAQINVMTHKGDEDYIERTEIDPYDNAMLHISDASPAEMYRRLKDFHSHSFRSQLFDRTEDLKLIAAFLHIDSLPVPTCKNGGYALYVAPGENGYEVHIHTHEELETMQDKLAQAGLGETPLIHRAASKELDKTAQVS